MVVQTRASVSDVMAITNEALQQDIRQMSLDMRRRFDDMENSLADKIRIAVNEIITDVRAELDAKLAALDARVMALEDRPAAPAQDDRSLNFVIYDMAESENENIEEKVNSLVSTQLSHPEVK